MRLNRLPLSAAQGRRARCYGAWYYGAVVRCNRPYSSTNGCSVEYFSSGGLTPVASVADGVSGLTPALTTGLTSPWAAAWRAASYCLPTFSTYFWVSG